MSESHQPRPGPTGLRRLFTPVNVVLATAIVAGLAGAAIMQFGGSEPPRPRMAISPPPADPSATASKATPTATQQTMPPLLNPNLEGITQGSMLPLFKTDPPAVGLPNPSQSTRVPVNGTDLFTGKACGYQSPTKIHKGYTVAFCCANSGGLNGGWDSLSEAEKDTYVRSFLK